MGEPISEIEKNSEKDPVLDFREEMERRIRESNGPIVVVPHSMPDSNEDRDCVYSAIVMRNILRKKFPDKQIDVRIADDGTSEKSEKYQEVMDQNEVTWNKGDFDKQIEAAGFVLMVDHFEFHRGGIPEETGIRLKNEGKLMILDHHEGKENTRDDYVEVEAKACTELVARMYMDELDAKEARRIALGILSDSGKLAFIREENPRTMQIYREVLKISGAKTSELIEELPHFTPEELAPIENTKQILTIPDYPNESVVIFSEPKEGIPAKDYGEMTTEVLNNATKFRPVEEIGDEMTADEKAIEATKADFSAFMYPINFGKGMSVEIKMRSNIFPIAGEIGELGNRGGNPYAAKFEFRPSYETQLKWAESDESSRTEIENEIINAAKDEFLKQYNNARKRLEIRDQLIKDFALTKEQKKKFKKIVRERIKWMYDDEALEEYDYKFGYIYRTNPDKVPDFDQVLGKAYDDFVSKVEKIR